MSQLVSRPTGGAITDVEQRPLITAILVTRNKESYLRECLCGLMEQSVAGRMEVIVVDQGSEQSEWAVIADLQRRYQNLISLRTAASAGNCAGLNLALRIASGSYLTVIEATDRLKDDAYELLAATLDASPDAVLAYGDTCFTAIPHESFANHTSYGKMIWPDYTFPQLTQLSLIAPHLMWRRDLHDSIGCFDARYESQGMRDFLLRVVERFRIVHIEEFTGLQLVAAGAPLNQDAAERELAFLRQNYQAAVRQTVAPSRAAQFSEPPPPAVPSAEEAYAEIQALVRSGTDLKAVSALTSHLAQYPEHALAHNDMAALSYRLGNTEKALSHYRMAVQLNPGESTYLKNLADICFVEAGQTDEAIGIYLKLLKSSPRDTETLLNLGIISEAVGQPAEAESFYRRALQIEPWNQAVRERSTELRRKAAEAATCQDEVSAQGRYGKAQAMVAQGDLDGATRELRGILAVFPDFPLAHNDLAVISCQNGAKEEALYHYEKAAALAPGNSTFQKNLADFYFVEGRNIDGAVAIYLEQHRQEPRNIDTLMNLGRICAMLDRPQEAETFYGKVTQLEPWNRDARECLTNLRHSL